MNAQAPGFASIKGNNEEPRGRSGSLQGVEELTLRLRRLTAPRRIGHLRFLITSQSHQRVTTPQRHRLDPDIAVLRTIALIRFLHQRAMNGPCPSDRPLRRPPSATRRRLPCRSDLLLYPHPSVIHRLLPCCSPPFPVPQRHCRMLNLGFMV